MIHMDVMGEGERNVVLLHGCPSPPEHLRELGEALAGPRRVFLAHCPGYGRSPAPERPYTMEEASGWVEDELLRRGVEAAALVGYSSGAYRALHLLARGRLRWQGVAALAGFGDLPEAQRGGYAQLAELLRQGVDLTDYLLESLLTPEVRATRPDIEGEVVEWVKLASAEAVAKELLAYAGGEDLLARLADLRVPVLALVGDRDQVQPPEVSRGIAEAAPLGELRILPGVGHLLLREDFAGTLAAVDAFFGRLSA